MGNPVCLEPSYRLAIAALAPWLRSSTGNRYRGGPDELAEGSGAVADAGNADLLERRARGGGDRGDRGARAVRGGGEREKRREWEKRTIRPFAGTEESPEAIASDDSAAARRNRTTTPKMDEALTRYKARAVHGRSGRSRQAGSARGDVCADG